jgi:hypothetical protein
MEYQATKLFWRRGVCLPGLPNYFWLKGRVARETCFAPRRLWKSPNGLGRRHGEG